MAEPREGARTGLSAYGVLASMTQGVSVRAATASDLPALMHLETLFPEGDRISAASWRRFIARQGCVVVAVADTAETEDLGAAVVLTRKGSQTMRLYSLAVDARAQGRGVGRALVEAALAVRGSALRCVPITPRPGHCITSAALRIAASCPSITQTERLR